MECRNLGSTGLNVSRICLGTSMMGDYVDQQGCTKVVDACLEQGINFIDTADTYNEGLSEQLLGKAMKGRRQEVIMATKVFVPVGPGVNDKGASRKHILDGVEASLRRLGTDYIDLYQIHFWDPETSIEETLRTLDDLVSQGKVRYIGCTNYAAWQVSRALWVSDKLGLERYASVQVPYSLGDRAIKAELLPLCADQRMGIISYQALMGGLLTGTYERNKEPGPGTHLASAMGQSARKRYWNDASFDLADKVQGLAAEVGRTPAHLALAWALAKPLITSVIVGASRPEQVIQNASALEIALTLEQLETLDRL